MQIVACVVPSTAHVDVLTVAVAAQLQASVVSVAGVAHQRIPSASLLPHIVQRHLLCAGIGVVGDSER